MVIRWRAGVTVAGPVAMRSASVVLLGLVLVGCGAVPVADVVVVEGAGGVDGGRKTIEGRVVSARGLPLEGLRLHVGNHETQSDAQGHFEFGSAWSPESETYDLVAVCAPPETDIYSAPCSGSDFAHAAVVIYQGLTQPKLELVWLRPGNATSVNVSLQGITFPIPAAEVVKWGVDHPAVYDYGPFVSPSGEALGTIRWGHSTEIQVAVAALHFEAAVTDNRARVQPVTYKSFGRGEGTLRHSLSEQSRFAVALKPLVADKLVKGSIQLPDNYELRRTTFITTSGSIRFEVGYDARPQQPEQFEFRSPEGFLAGACALARRKGASGSEGTTSCSFSNSDTVGLKVFPTAVPIEPSEGAQVSLPVRLSWTSPENSKLSVVKMTLSAPAFSSIDVIGYTSKNAFEVPDLSKYGIRIPANASLIWSIASTNSYSLEGQTKGNSGSTLFPVFPVAGENSWYGESASRTLVLKGVRAAR